MNNTANNTAEIARAVENAARVPLPLGIGACLLCLGIGLLFILSPDMVWEWKHLFTVRDGEPTDFYLITTRIAGVVWIIIGIVILAMTIMSYM